MKEGADLMPIRRTFHSSLITLMAMLCWILTLRTRRQIMIRSCFAAVALFALAALALGQAPPRPVHPDGYTVTDLGILPEKKSATVYGTHSVNKAGDVAGHCNNGDLVTGLFGDFFTENVAFLWTKQGGIQALPTPPGAANASGWTLNDRGQVIGNSGSSYLDLRLVLWENGTVRAFEPLPGDTFTGPQAINNRGQIVGESGISLPDGSFAQALHPVLWDAGQARVLPMAGSAHGQANDINEKGQIVGILMASPDFIFDMRPILWDPQGGVIELGSLGGGFGFAWDINDKGQVVGQSQAPDGSIHAFFWENGRMTDLGTRGGTWTGLWALNNKGQAAGEASDATEDIHAILIENGVMFDLNDFIPADSGWVLVSAGGINERGQISGYGIHNGEVRGYLLTPTKAP
jgi:probable HAF family extracellular repeat protein